MRGAPLRGDRGQGDRCRRRPAPLRFHSERPGGFDRGVPGGARRGRGGREHTFDRAGRRRCRAVAAAARGAAGCNTRTGLVARRRAVRTRAADRPRPRCGHGQRLPRGGAVRNIERAKWRLWHGRWPGCRRKLVDLLRWTKRKHRRDVAGIGRLQRHVAELLGYLERNQDALVHYAARRRRGEPISTAFVESAVNEIVAKRMNKAQQMRWNRTTVQPFLDVRTAVLNGTLEDAFRQRYPGFRPAND